MKTGQKKNLLQRMAFSARNKMTAITAGAMAVIGSGMAHADAAALAAAAQAEVAGIEGGVDPILTSLIVVVFLILAFLYFRKAAK